MKIKIQRFFILLFVAMTTFSLSSCVEDDWWYEDWWDDGGWNDDRRVEQLLRGRWYVDRVYPGHGNVPYYPSDCFHFKSNGYVEVLDHGQIIERGYWYVDDRYLLIDFNGDRYNDLEAYIVDLYRDYVALDVKDYLEGSDYGIDLVK